MPTSIGKYSKSFFIKVLVGIIILPFVFWGMGDIFRGGNQNILVSIDSEKISTQEFTNYLNRLNLTEEQRKNINKTDLLEKIISEYIGKKIIDLEIKDMNIDVSDKALKNIIVNDKTFYKDGKFSRIAYEKFLLESSMTAPAFESAIVEQEKKRRLLSYLSKGTIIRDFLIESEFRKENQIKTIKYIDLNNFYKNRIIKESDAKKLYDDNKKLFVELFKNLNFVELTPESLTGEKEFNENFFTKINKIENELLDGKSTTQIIKENNLKLIKISEINKQKKDANGKKIDLISDLLFEKVFKGNSINSPKLFIIEDKYYIAEIISENKKQISFDDKRVQDAINAQLKIQDKLKNNTKIAKDMAVGEFNLEKIKLFADKNKLTINNLTISNIEDNKIFSKSLIKRIFESNKDETSLLTDSALSKNFIIYTEKTEYKKLERNSKDYKKYKAKAKFEFANNVYATYDRSINGKYKIELNDKVIERIKNSL